uniref:AT1G08220-like protein n=1 Tax=Melianthus villosus TaxID=377280 RepID=A0A0G4ALJ6_9ROSI|nr:AT1G08220-like protein [Melianthus villosus]
MFIAKRLLHQNWSIKQAILSSGRFVNEEHGHFSLPLRHLEQRTSIRSLDIYQIGNKEAVKKERARLADEMTRGYFADMSELKQHGGKIAVANKIIIPAIEAVKFPALEVNYSDGKMLKIPSNGTVTDADQAESPKASLVCLSFRASSQAMIASWTTPFLGTFSDKTNIDLYEVSLIDSQILCWKPIKRMLLKMMKNSNHQGENDGLKRQIVYSFGDHYYFRKELKILNLLTGYIFLIDKFGRIRWKGFGMATEDELSSLLSCTSLLLEEE